MTLKSLTPAPTCTPHCTVDAALACALDLLKDPDRWIQGAFGKTVEGDELNRHDLVEKRWDTTDPPAQFCLIGAVEYCAATEYVAEETLEYITDAINTRFVRRFVITDDIPEFNDDDETTHTQIVQVLQDALHNQQTGVIPMLGEDEGKDGEEEKEEEANDE